MCPAAIKTAANAAQGNYHRSMLGHDVWPTEYVWWFTSSATLQNCVKIDLFSYADTSDVASCLDLFVYLTKAPQPLGDPQLNDGMTALPLVQAFLRNLVCSSVYGRHMRPAVCARCEHTDGDPTDRDLRSGFISDLVAHLGD